MPQNTLNLPTTSAPVLNNQRLIAFVVIALCVIFAFTFKARLDRLTALRAEIYMWEARTQEAEAHQAALYKQLVYVKTDEYVVAVAREELGLIQKGDELIVVVGDRNTDFGLVNTPDDSTPRVVVTPMNVALNLSESSSASGAYSSVRDFQQGETLLNGMAQNARPIPIWEQWLDLFFYQEPTQ